MRDRPDLDEMEPPPARASTPIDGLTDEQWAARRLRRDAVFRVAFGLVFGFVVAMLAVWHWMLLEPRALIAGSLVVIGCMILFATLFARRRDEDAIEYAQWVAFTEWKFFERMPWWMLALILYLLAVSIVAFAAVMLGALLS